MIATEFVGHNVVIAKDQPGYIPLPAFHNPKEGSLTFCFELNKEEIEEISKTGKIWFKQLTFNKPMNPICLSTQKSDLIP